MRADVLERSRECGGKEGEIIRKAHGKRDRARSKG